MSLPSLLSHFGIDDQRFVTSTGRVIFDGVTKSPLGQRHSHPEYGVVTPVETHRFHGDEPEPQDGGADGAWWADEAELERHDSAVRAAFPGFTRVEGHESEPPVWVGTLDTGRGKFTIAVCTRWDRELPSVTILKGQKPGVATGRSWVPSPHLYLNGALCIADRTDWKPAEHTVATAITWSAHWLAAYTEWRMIRRWPVDGAQARAA